MPSAAPNSSLELLTFLSDGNAQVRQLAISNLTGFSSKQSSQRNLLTSIHRDSKGNQVKGRDGRPMDTIQDLKNLCSDLPITAHDAFTCLINLSDSLLVAKRIADESFLTFLVQYISDPISLLTDLACMLLSNLTKLESISSLLLSLKVSSGSREPTFFSSEEAASFISGMDADPSSPDYLEKKQEMQRRQEAILSQKKNRVESQSESVPVPAMSRLLDAFEEGSTVENQVHSQGGLQEMKKRAVEAHKEKSHSASQDGNDDTPPKVKRKSNCNFLASVFANVTVLPAGRQWFITPLATSASASASTSTSASTTFSSEPISGSAQTSSSKDSSPLQDGSRAQDEDRIGNMSTRGRVNSHAGGESGMEIEETRREYPISRIMPFTEHPDLIRRGGVISCIKNILFLKSSHPLLIAPPPFVSGEESPLHDRLRRFKRPNEAVDLLPYLLLPLCDGQELSKLDFEDQETLPEECQLMNEDKKREKDRALRLMLVECLLLLTTGLYGRMCLRARGTYIVVREAHLREDDEKIAEAVVRLVNILQREESEDSLREEESEDGSVANQVGAEKLPEEEDEDDEDLVIEEL